MATPAAMIKKAPPATVVSAGLMRKTVKARIVKQEWNKRLRKYYATPHLVLVRDPNSSLRTGDRIQIEPERYTTHVRHVVSSIIAPFGTPTSSRPPVLTADQRAALKEPKKEARIMRRAQRGVLSALEAAKERGLWDGVTPLEPLEEKEEEGTTDAVGRKSLKGGGHKFGKINDEGKIKGQRTKKLKEKALKNETENARQQERATEAVARQKLQENSGQEVEHVEKQ